MEILDQQIKVEENALREILDIEESVTEPAVRLILMELRLDTWRHKKLLQGIKEIISQVPCDEWSSKVQRYIDRIKLERSLESILEKEGEMIELLSQALDEVDDPLARAIFERLRNDEHKHDTGLRDVISMIKTAPLQSVKAQKGSDIVC